MKPIERVHLIIKEKGFSIGGFEVETGMSNNSIQTAIKRNSNLKDETLNTILNHFPDINPTWLLTGREKMYTKGSYSKDHELKEEILLVNEPETSYELKKIPLVSIGAVAGFGNSNFSIGERDVKEYYVVPKFHNKKIDFMIEVEGNSMYPKYNSGDIVACRIINEKNFIQPNKVHVVATHDQGMLLKRIKPGSTPDHYRLISDNKDYDPFEVSSSDISGIALVVGLIRIE